jgi:ribosomal protein S18 acetylase RimI-like enzyme
MGKDTAKVVIRNARPGEADDIHRVLVAAFRGLRGRGYSHQAIEAAIVPPGEIVRRMVEGGHVLVAQVGGQIVGTVTGLEEHQALHVCSLAVYPGNQGRGIARRLMEALEEVARRQGCHKLWLQTAWAMTEASALYERLGYQQEGYQSRQFYGEDFLVFGKVLENDAGAQGAHRGTGTNCVQGGDRA